jgi:hypothetical protein
LPEQNNSINPYANIMKHSKTILLAITMLLAAPAIFTSCKKDDPKEEESPKYVDLGLPSGTKWATCNIGANTPESTGFYFAFGETEARTFFDSESYDRSNATKDAANFLLGEHWHIPTISEWNELTVNCTWTWDETRKGYIVSGNGNSIFLPAAGVIIDSLFGDGKTVEYSGTKGFYWTSEIKVGDTNRAWNFSISKDKYEVNFCFRFDGLPIRPIYR